MKESPRDHAARTGRAYAPPAALARQARVLGPAVPCPTLFRFPGPAGLQDQLSGAALPRWAPAGAWLWLSEDPAHTPAAGVFGTLAVLQPLSVHACQTDHAGLWLAAGAPDADAVVWVPPSAVRRGGVGLTRAATAAEAVAVFGEAAWQTEREATRDRLSAYLEELSMLAAASVPGPERPWCEVAEADRRALLAEAGVSGRWTG